MQSQVLHTAWMSYFLWGCRGIFTLITLRSERVNTPTSFLEGCLQVSVEHQRGEEKKHGLGQKFEVIFRGNLHTYFWSVCCGTHSALSAFFPACATWCSVSNWSCDKHISFACNTACVSDWVMILATVNFPIWYLGQLQCEEWQERKTNQSLNSSWTHTHSLLRCRAFFFQLYFLQMQIRWQGGAQVYQFLL